MGAVETLEILAPGPLTTVQDRGRFGFGQYGVPPSGALDSFGDVAISTSQERRGPFLQRPQERLPRLSGDRGGISVPSIMGSKSTNLAAQFGGLEGRPLRKGDIISSDSPARHLNAVGRSLDKAMIPSYTKDQGIRVISGPQDDHFSTKAQDIFTGSLFRVTPQSDRTGIRLAGPRIEAKKSLKESIISEGVVPGTIQIPGDAQPIIILGETVTGGYRKIATVISADLPLLGQLKPGDTINFRKVSMDETYQAVREMEGTVVGSF